MKIHSDLRKILFPNQLGWLMALIIILPNIILYFGLSTSLALGTALVGLFIIFATYHTQNCLPNVIINRFSTGVSIALITFIILLHITVASSIWPIDIKRSILSVFILIVFILSAAGFSSFLATFSNKAIKQAVLLMVFFMFVVAVNSFFGFTPFGENASIRPMFPFCEPSHFALTALPFLMYACVLSSLLFRIVFILSVTVLAIAIQNATLLLGCLIVLLISNNFKTIIVMLIVVGLFLFFQVDTAYFSDRANISMDNNNLSTLVYLQGWQLIPESWERTIGIGLGFQQLGISEIDVPASLAIQNILGSSLNAKDGGFLLSKFLSEFGVIGLFVILMYVRLLFFAIHQLKLIAKNNIVEKNSVVISYCFIVSFTFEILVRGSGYFTYTSLFAFTAIIYLHRLQILTKKWNVNA